MESLIGAKEAQTRAHKRAREREGNARTQNKIAGRNLWGTTYNLTNQNKQKYITYKIIIKHKTKKLPKRKNGKERM